MKRMFAPDDEDKPFIARWNMLVRILLVESSIKHIARAAMDYADFDDGSSCHPSNERLARETGYNEKTVRTAWAAMRAMGIAERVGNGVSYLRLADEYHLQIPTRWKSMPILGPHARKFTCPACGKVFNPNGNCTLYPNDEIRYNVSELTFCPAPRQRKGRDEPACLSVWNARQKKLGGQSFHDSGQEVWKLFHQARGDDW